MQTTIDLSCSRQGDLLRILHKLGFYTSMFSVLFKNKYFNITQAIFSRGNVYVESIKAYQKHVRTLGENCLLIPHVVTAYRS